MLCKRTALYLNAKNKDPGHNSLSSQCRGVAPVLRFTVGRDTPTDTPKTGVEGKPGSTGLVRCSGTMVWAVQYLGGFLERCRAWKGRLLPEQEERAGPSAWRCSAVPHLGYLTNWHSAHWVSDSACQIHAVPHCSSRRSQCPRWMPTWAHREGKEAQQLLINCRGFFQLAKSIINPPIFPPPTRFFGWERTTLADTGVSSAEENIHYINSKVRKRSTTLPLDMHTGVHHWLCWRLLHLAEYCKAYDAERKPSST